MRTICLTKKLKCDIMGVAHSAKEWIDNQRRNQHMKTIYTLQTTLRVIDNKDTETLLDVNTAQFAYRSRENAYKALQELKKAHIAIGSYDPTRSDFSLVKRSIETGQTYTLDFEIKEFILSDYEQ